MAGQKPERGGMKPLKGFEIRAEEQEHRYKVQTD